MIIPKSDYKLVYKYLMKEGVIVVEKNAHLERHKDIPVRNLFVMLMMRSMKSRDLVNEVFSWQNLYYTLKKEGVDFLVSYLGLPEGTVPDTHRSVESTRSETDYQRRPRFQNDRQYDRPRRSEDSRFGGRRLQRTN